MPLHPRFATLLWALMLSVLGGPRAMAQTTAPAPLIEVEGTLQDGDDTLESGRFYDSYEFSGQANQTVTILLESEAFDPYLILEDDQGDRIATNNDVSSVNSNAALVIALPAAARYRVITRAQDTKGQGAYQLTIHSTSAGQPNPLLSAAEVTLLEAKERSQAGNAHYQRSEFRVALMLWEEALALFRTENVRITFLQDSAQGEAISLGNLGVAHYYLNDYERAIDFQKQSLDITRRIGDRQGEATSLGNLGLAHHTLGDYAQAINFYQEHLTIALQSGDRRSEGNALGNLGLVHSDLGDYAQAINFSQKALYIFRQTNDRGGEAGSLGNLGSAHSALGEYDRAIDFHQQALNIFRQIGDRQDEAISLGNLGSAHSALGKYGRAIDYHQQSLDIKRQIGDRQGEATSLGNLGSTYHVLDEYTRAINFYQQQLDIVRQIGHRRGESISLHNLGLAFWDLEDLAEAERYLKTSAQIKESLHSANLTDTNRLSLLDSQQQTYHLWQLTLMAQGQPELALEVAERGRAQALVTRMSRSLNTAADEFELSTPPNLERIQAIAAEQNATLVKYSVLPFGRLLIWVIQPDGTIYSTESDAAALDDSLMDTTGQFATLGQNGSRGGEHPETPLSTLVQDTQAALTRGDSSDSVSSLSRQQLDTQLQQLHEVLIEPIAQWLPTDDQQRVIFIPHRELFRVPFAALRDSEGNYLIQHHIILTAPSIQSLELARQHRTRIQSMNTTAALIVGNPYFPDTLTTAYGWQTLPGAEREARNVGTYLSQYLGTSPTVLLHDQATETQVKEQLHSARFIHLATHGNLVSVNERTDLPGVQYSFIPGLLALAASDQDDGSLTADELRDLTRTNPLNAELVVLSACQTGQGRVTSDGVDGLSRTLLTAGVPTMLVSLWNASDHHTAGLMDEFYRQFLEEDQDKAQALRQAMLQMIEQGDDNPQHWAAFTLVGEAE
ncbi:CHAT domain-containing protein [Leptothoe sp. ISB3NOV94-8A]